MVAAAGSRPSSSRSGQARCSSSSRRTYQIDNTPNNHGDHLGSAYQEGWYGYVLKDLRVAQAPPVAQKLRARPSAGGGRLAACRKALQASLKSALGEKSTAAYPADDVCKAGDGERVPATRCASARSAA